MSVSYRTESRKGARRDSLGTIFFRLLSFLLIFFCSLCSLSPSFRRWLLASSLEGLELKKSVQVLLRNCVRACRGTRIKEECAETGVVKE